MLVRAAQFPPGDALDLACGRGRHAKYLANLGWRVTAVDSSPVALSEIGPPVTTVLANLERQEFVIQPESWDLIVQTLYTQRDLHAKIRDGLRVGGIFAGCFLTTGRFGLSPADLRADFADWEILHFAESPHAGILARKPRSTT